MKVIGFNAWINFQFHPKCILVTLLTIFVTVNILRKLETSAGVRLAVTLSLCPVSQHSGTVVTVTAVCSAACY